jgi:hypothetical protein
MVYCGARRGGRPRGPNARVLPAPAGQVVPVVAAGAAAGVVAAAAVAVVATATALRKPGSVPRPQWLTVVKWRAGGPRRWQLPARRWPASLPLQRWLLMLLIA